MNAHQRLQKLTAILSQGGYHDGNTLGQVLGISRAAVWKYIQKLEDYGVSVDATKGQGYRLAKPLIMLEQAQLNEALAHHHLNLEVVETISSTNTYLKQLSLDNTQIRLIMAEMQTAGRGRLGRTWHSPFGENLYFSLAYPFKKELSQLAGLSLVVSLALIEALNTAFELSHPVFQVKWPNDILVKGAKLAGTLIEIMAESNSYCQVIIGIGINVNMEEAPSKTIQQPFTSLWHITQSYQDRNKLIPIIIDQLVSDIKQFTHEGLSSFMSRWKRYDYLNNREIKVSLGNQVLKGTCRGISPDGQLCLEDERGKINLCPAGDSQLVK